MTNIRPLHDRVMVEPKEEQTTAGGIVIPDTAGDKPQYGVIRSAGAGKRQQDGTITPLDVKVGDTVLFGKYSGTEVKVDGKGLLMMREEDIMGIVE